MRRERGAGSAFYSEADGGWIALVSLGSRNGKRIRKKARAGRCRHADPPRCKVCKRLAEANREDILRQYQSGGPAMTMTLDAYMADWLRDVRPTIRPSTFRSYQGHVDHHISPLLGGMVVGKIQPADVRRLISATLARGNAPATVGRIISTLHNALDVAYREGSLPRNAAAVKLPKVEREPIRAMTPDDAAALLEAVEGHPFEAVYRLLLGSGMRLGEALGLDWSDLQLEEGYVNIRVSKTQVRAVPISDDAVHSLNALISQLSEYGRNVKYGPVFVGPRKGERLRGDTVYHAWVRLLERRGLERMRVHDLRHGVATLMLADGAHMRLIGEQLGHKNPRTTHQYAHVVPMANRAAIGVLDRLRSKA